MTTDRSCEIF